MPVKASAGARKNEIRGEFNRQLKVSVTQVAEKGKANNAIISVLSKTLDIPRSKIRLYSGATSSEKIFLFSQIELTVLKRKIALAIGDS